MARIMLTGVDELTLKLSRLESGSDEIAKKAIYKGAGVMADEIKRRLVENLNDPASVSKKNDVIFKIATNEPTGDLLESFGITPIAEDAVGNWNVKLGFDGYDRNGVPNQLKARAMESGTSTLKKRPFVRPAVNATRNKVKDAMREVIDKETEKVMKG